MKTICDVRNKTKFNVKSLTSLIDFVFSLVSGSRGSVRYSIYSGDPDGYFTIDPNTGLIRTASPLDHEAHQSVLLNVQAMSGSPPSYGHTQVNTNFIIGRNLYDRFCSYPSQYPFPLIFQTLHHAFIPLSIYSFWK